jgi:hypothetical protein
VSTARGGESSAFEPGLEHLIGALTASGHPDELAGRDAARAAFCAASQQPTTARSGWAWPASTWSARRRGPIRIALPARLAVAIAVVAAVFGGFAAAAAAQVLPAPVQRIADNVLAPLGVPVSRPAQSHHRQSASPRPPSFATGPASSHGGCPCATATTPSAGSGTGHHRKTKPKATAKATATAKAKKSSVKPVLRLVYKQPDDRLIVAAPSGRPGDIVNLTEWTGAAWTTVASAPLGPGRRAVFVRPAKTTAGHLFEAEVLEGASHAAVASNGLWIPRPAATGAKVIQPSPTTSPAGPGSPAPTPSPAPTTSQAGTGSPVPTPAPTQTPQPVSNQLRLSPQEQLRVVRRTSGDGQAPGDDDEEEPGEPGGAARRDADA